MNQKSRWDGNEGMGKKTRSRDEREEGRKKENEYGGKRRSILQCEYEAKTKQKKAEGKTAIRGEEMMNRRCEVKMNGWTGEREEEG